MSGLHSCCVLQRRTDDLCMTTTEGGSEQWKRKRNVFYNVSAQGPAGGGTGGGSLLKHGMVASAQRLPWMRHRGRAELDVDGDRTELHMAMSRRHATARGWANNKSTCHTDQPNALSHYTG